MIRVLVVDDSPTARNLLVEILQADPDIEVAGVAGNGREGVEQALALQPDLVTMDIQMPVMNGFEATKEIMIESPTPIVIVSSSTRVAEVEVSMKALRAGALTLIRKPPGPGSDGFSSAQHELISKVKALSGLKVVRHRRESIASPAVAPTAVSGLAPADNPYRAIAIACSTGGPPALHAVLAPLPANFPAPVFVVQHIAQGFVQGFAKWLDSVTPMRVKLAEDRELSQAGVIYIAPEDVHLGVSGSGRIILSDAAPLGGFRPAADFLFQSVASAFGKHSISAILTGMGCDGASGMYGLHQAGAMTIAQDEKTSVVYGMPRATIEKGAARQVLPLQEIGAAIIKLVTKEGA